MVAFQDAFISYGRADSKAFATKLHDRLVQEGLSIWFDQNDIPLGVDFQNQIDDGLEKSHNFLFIIAPHSVNSPYCGKEIELAIQRNKRIIPLLHVEQITRETWQQRNPNGTDEQWAAYQAKGLHSSFNNMHPVIGKINWVYFREGIDDFEASLQGLLEVINRHKDYVEQHTFLLAKALDWSRNQRQPRYLLTGRDRQRAVDWLQVRFKNEQPPSEPTDLHCEFICESTKNANNLMTQVFLCYDKSDRAVMDKVRRSLMRDGFTIWTDANDIQMGEDPKLMSDRGIEGADNIVYILSQKSLDSGQCQRELDHAFRHNKRIIPLQLEAIESLSGSSRRARRGLDSIYTKLEGEKANPLPAKLRSLQFIDLTQHTDLDSYQTAIDKLIVTLRDKAAYYELHKILLTRALKWEEQHQNASILLRGYRLEKADAWLKSALQDEHPPTDLQQQYIANSLQQPPEVSLDVFISYPLEESDFARRLNEALQLQGKTTWFDQDNVASRLEFPSEVIKGLESCDNMLVLLSPDLLDLPNYADEVRHALALNKRTIVVLPYGLPEGGLPAQLQGLPVVDFSDDGGSFAVNFSELVRQLELDREYVHSHTQWLQRAIAWQQQGSSPDLLLRGNELAIASAWLEAADRDEKHPLVTDLHRAFINAGQRAAQAAEDEEKRQQELLLKLQEERAQEAEARLVAEQQALKRQQIFLQVVSIGLFAALGLAGWMLSLYRQSSLRRVESLVLSSEALFNSNRQLEALLNVVHAKRLINRLALDTEEDVALQAQVDLALQRVVYGIQEFNRLEGLHTNWVNSVAISSDGERIVTTGADGLVGLWTMQGQLLQSLNDHDAVVNQVLFHPAGDRFLTASDDGTIHLWTVEGELLQSIDAHDNGVTAIALNSSGNLLVSVGNDNTLKQWTLSGQLQRTTPLPDGPATEVAIMPNGQAILTGSRSGTLQLWALDGTPQQRITVDDEIGAIAISPDGQTIAAAGFQGDITLWKPDGSLDKTLEGHSNRVEALVFLDNQTLVSGSRDSTIKLWLTSGILRETFTGHRDWILGLGIHAQSQTIASASADGTVKLWRPNDIVTMIDAYNQRELWDITVNPDGQALWTGSSDALLRKWSLDGRMLLELKGHTDGIDNVDISPDGQTVASASWDGTVILWTQEGIPQRTLQVGGWLSDTDYNDAGDLLAVASDTGIVSLWNPATGVKEREIQLDEPITTIDFHPTQPDVMMAGSGNNIYLLRMDGSQIRTIAAHDAAVLDADFSDAGDMIASSSRDRTIKLWSLEGTLLRTLSAHTDWVWSVSFSPSGKFLASGSSDQTIRLWNLEGKLLTTLSRHRAAVEDVSFGVDDSFLVSSGWDGAIGMWNLGRITEMNELETACQWIADYLNSGENLVEGDRQVCNNLENDDDVPWFEEGLEETAQETPQEAPQETP